MRYRFLKRKNLESLERYEKRLNDETTSGWRVVSITHDGYTLVALLERTQNF